MNKPYSRALEERIRSHVMADLEPSWVVTHTKVALASIFGGLLSLLACGQFGFGFSSIADSFNHTIHENMGAIPCALICGTFYAIFPVAVLRFVLCAPIQFRAIMRRRKSAIAIWFISFGAAMSSFGHHGNDILILSSWIVAALLTAHITSYMMNLLIPCWNWNARLKFMS